MPAVVRALGSGYHSPLVLLLLLLLTVISLALFFFFFFYLSPHAKLIFLQLLSTQVGMKNNSSRLVRIGQSPPRGTVAERGDLQFYTEHRSNRAQELNALLPNASAEREGRASK